GGGQRGTDEDRQQHPREPHLPQGDVTGGVRRHRPPVQADAVQDAARHLGGRGGDLTDRRRRRGQHDQGEHRDGERGHRTRADAGAGCAGQGGAVGGACAAHARVPYTASARAATTRPVLGPKLSSTESDMSTTRRCCPAGVWAMPGTFSSPSTPPSDSSPSVITRITCGAAAIIASLVTAVNGSVSPAAVPASSPPMAVINESAPEPGPASMVMALLRRYRNAMRGRSPSSGTSGPAASISWRVRRASSRPSAGTPRSEEHTSELQSREILVCR